MTLITKALTEQLLANGRAQRGAMDKNGRSRFEQTLGWPAGRGPGTESEYKGEDALDFKPVVKLFTPDAQCTWLLTELDSDGLAFGLCDLGMGEPELGYVSLIELAAVRGKLGLPIERDLHFTADKPISAYTEEARQLRRIVA